MQAAKKMQNKWDCLILNSGANKWTYTRLRLMIGYQAGVDLLVTPLLFFVSEDTLLYK